MDDLKRILQSVLKTKVPGFSAKEKELEIFQCWSAAVGEKVAKHCWPVKMIDKDTLLVASESNTWLQQLRYLEEMLLDNLEKQLNERRIKKLSYKIEMRNGK